MSDIGLTHVALPITDPKASLEFYERYAGMRVVHRRKNRAGDAEIFWLSDRTRPFVIVLIQCATVDAPLRPIAHLGVGCRSRSEVDRLCGLARREGRLVREPEDSGYPVGYWALLRDPDGHTLEIAHGQEVALTVEASD